MSTAPDKSTAQSRSSRLQAFWGRLRHGLLTQEILDRLGRAGLLIYPYFVTTEPTPIKASLSVEAPCTLRFLTAADTAEILRVTVASHNASSLVARLEKAMCLGLFYDGELAAYTWASSVAVPIPGSGSQPLFELRAAEAYLFDMYVAPAYRGSRLAGILRQSMQQQLIRQGRNRFYSITLAFNRSSRRFKARLGVKEVELRLYVHLRLGRLPGIDCRLQRRDPDLRSPLFKRVSAAAGNKRRA